MVLEALHSRHSTGSGGKLNSVPVFREFKQEELTTAEVKEEVALQIAMKENLEATLPDHIYIGSFNVCVKPLKDSLTQKRQESATGLLAMLTEKLRTDVDAILEEYTEIRVKLREVPQSIEHIFEIRDWMETIPLRVRHLEDQMEVLKLDFDVLDGFWWNISDEDFEAKWEAIGSPLRIEMEVKGLLRAESIALGMFVCFVAGPFLLRFV